MTRDEAIEKAAFVVQGRMAIESKKKGMSDEVISAYEIINKENIRNNISQYLEIFETAEVIEIED